MRDLWKDLATRVRQAEHAVQPEAPFAFADAVLRQARLASRQRLNLLEDWLPVLRPALGLAFGTALICVLLQYRVEREQPSDALTQTEALIQYVVLND